MRSLPAERPGSSPLWIPIEVGVVGFACWTLSYHLVLITRLPARTTGPVFGVLVLLAVRPAARRWRGALRSGARNLGSGAALAILSLSTGLFALLTQRPDSDDFDYFHRVLSQAARPGDPFLVTDTTHRLVGPAPAFSGLHLMTSYEPLFGFVGGLVGLDPLALYQNAPALAAGALLPVVYVLLYREFRLRRIQAVAAAAIAVGFLVIDGNVHRSFGNVTLVRLWQGKAVLWTLLVPLTFLLCRRFLRRPTRGNLVTLALTAVCGVGLSGSGLFLLPASIAAAWVCDLCVRRNGCGRWGRTMWMNTTWAYPAVIALAYVLGVLPRPRDIAIWNEGWPEAWGANLGLVIDSWATLMRDLWILLALPLAGLQRPLGRLVVGYSMSLFLLFLNPVSGTLWLRAVQPAAYWRFLYLLPLPWCAGLAVPCIADRRRAGEAGWATAGIASLSVVLAFRAHVLRPSVTLKGPFDYRFPSAELSFVRSALPSVHGRNVLAPESIVTIMGLLDPGIRFEATRPASTRSAFRNAGQAQEGERRIAAQGIVSSCEEPSTLRPADAEVLQRSVKAGIDAIVVADCAPARHRVLEVAEKGRWSPVLTSHGYVLLLQDARRGPASGAPSP